MQYDMSERRKKKKLNVVTVQLTMNKNKAEKK